MKKGSQCVCLEGLLASSHELKCFEKGSQDEIIEDDIRPFRSIR